MHLPDPEADVREEDDEGIHVDRDGEEDYCKRLPPRGKGQYGGGERALHNIEMSSSRGGFGGGTIELNIVPLKIICVGVRAGEFELSEPRTQTDKL